MATVFDFKQFASAIQDYCRSQNITQQFFADAVDVSRTNISFYMNGKQRPTMEVFTRICTMLNRNPAEFFISRNPSPLQFLMGKLGEQDHVPLDRAFEKIRVLRKYASILDEAGDEIDANRC